MRRTIKYYKIIWLRHDLPAGLSVFLVALPLCLGIALASGAPLYGGILSGIIGGIVVSIISGSALSVSGPAAGLSTVVAATILSYGDYKVFLLVVIVAIIVALASLAFLILLQQPFSRKWKVIPAPLIAVLAGVLINYLFTRATSAYSLKTAQLVYIPQNIFGNISFPAFSKFFSNGEI